MILLPLIVWESMGKGDKLDALRDTAIKLTARLEDLEKRHYRLLQRLAMREAKGGELLPQVPTNG